MTLALAWTRGGEAFLCCDSAATSRAARSPFFPESSFGESQNVNGHPVEESVLKLAPVATSAALLVGDAKAATDFCERLTRLAAGESVAQRLERLDAIFRSTKPEFSVVVPQVGIERPLQLLHYSPGRGPQQLDAPAVIIDGSLDANYRRLILSALAGIQEARETQRFTAEEEHVAMICFLQLLSTFEILPAQSVGGAFLGVRVGKSIKWPPPISYFFCDPPTLAAMATCTTPTLAARMDGIARVRSRAEDWIGVVSSSITQRVMLLRSPCETRPIAMLGRIAFGAGGNADFANDKYCAFINREKQRVVVTINGARRLVTQFSNRAGSRLCRLHGTLATMLTEPIARPGWDVRLLSLGARGIVNVRGVLVESAPVA